MKKKQLEKLHEALALLNESAEINRDHTRDITEVVDEMQFLTDKSINILTQLYLEELYNREIEKLKKEALLYKEE